MNTSNLTEGNPTTIRLFNLYHDQNDRRLTGPPAIAGGLQATVTLLLNATLFAFIISRRKLKMKKSNKFFLNLQTVNILQSASVIISLFYVDTKTEMLINNALLITMFLCLVITTIDRYTVIKFPYKYEKLKKGVVLLIIACSWLPGLSFILSGIISTIEKQELIIISIVMFCFAAIILTTSNIKVYLIAKEHGNRVKRNVHKKILKCTYVCITIVLSFVMLWFPFFIHNILALLNLYAPRNNKVFTIVAVQIGLLHSMLGPLLYVLFQRDAKVELRKSLNRARNSATSEAMMNQSVTAQPLQNVSLGMNVIV